MSAVHRAHGVFTVEKLPLVLALGYYHLRDRVAKASHLTTLRLPKEQQTTGSLMSAVYRAPLSISS